MSTFRVVIADDVAEMRLLLRLSLERAPEFEIVAEAADGVEAVEAVEAHRPDLVLLDVSMPRMDGLEALAQIRTLDPEVKVIVLSAFADESLAATALSAGADRYIEKGVEPDDLLSEVRRLLSAALAEVATRLDATAASPGAARRFVGKALEEWDLEQLCEVVALLLSELVTNAVLHARTDVDVRVRLLDGRLRVEVADGSRELPTLHEMDVSALSGRGLALVDALAEEWGVEPSDDGKTVWFEVGLPI